MLNIITTFFKAITGQLTDELSHKIGDFMRDVYPTMSPEGRQEVRRVMRETL